MELTQRFTEFFLRHQLQKKTGLLVAVSGGIDSVVLCALCAQQNIPFSIAHCNFSLRGEESARDEAFVRRLGDKYSVPVAVKKFDTLDYAQQHAVSVQEAARTLRYQWFAEKRAELGAGFIALAHHADDNIETLLMHFFRGTGLHGMTGMSDIDHQRKLIRPLLAARRMEIETYAKAQSLEWVEDSSNSQSKYTRNYFRNELIPAITKVFPQVEENLLDNIRRFRQTENLYRMGIEQIRNRICKKEGDEMKVPVKKLMEYKDSSLLYEIIGDYGFKEKQVEELIRLASAATGKFMENESYRIIRHRNWFVFAPKTGHSGVVLIPEGSGQVSFDGCQLHMRQVEAEKFELKKNSRIAQLDMKKIEFPLVLRKWKTGDYFYPLGMRKKKKLSRFFIDQKLSRSDKEKIWVLESGERIVWVAGLRIDDRFKILPSTKKILEISCSTAPDCR